MACREALDADFSVRERVRWGDPMAHLARKKLAEAGPPPPVLPAHLQKKTGDGLTLSRPFAYLALVSLIPVELIVILCFPYRHPQTQHSGC